MFDETKALAEAALITLDQGTANKATEDESYATLEGARDGCVVEQDIEVKGVRDWQGRVRSVPPDVAATIQKLATNSKASVVAAGQLYAAHKFEQAVIADVIAFKQRAVLEARKNLEHAELALMRADLARQKAAAILLGVKHLHVAAMVREADPTIELPISETLTAAVDNVIELQQLIARKESK